MNILIGVIATTLFVLALLEHPYFFRYHSLRFVYKSGLLLYSRTFTTQTLANKPSPSRGHILYWMTESGFLFPKAQEDGEGRFLLMEYLWHIGLRGDIHIPALMRAKISWDSKEKNVVVRGYATWTYLLIFIFALVMLFTPSKVEGNLCGDIVFFACIFCYAIVYAYQVPHLQSIGAKATEYLSREE